MNAPHPDALPASAIVDAPIDLLANTPAESPSSTAPAVPFVPIANNQRIEALDVVRGFALLGIFLMNIEWFNRPFGAMNEGIPRSATGLDWWATWFVNYFVQGKFWTIFSLLFGMGFAVMLVRAENAGRPFVKVYLRRILALAVFGAVHYIFIWQGDILFSYAVGALALLIVLYGKPKPIIAGTVVLLGLGFIPDAEGFFGMAAGLAMTGLLALYLRSDKRVTLRGKRIPLFSFLLMFAGLGAAIAGAVFWLLPDGPIEPRWPLSVFGPLVAVTGWLSWKYHEPAEKRSLRLSIAIYVFFGALMTAGSFIQFFAPDPAALGATPATVAAAGSANPADAPLAAAAKSDAKPDVKPVAKPDAAKTDAQAQQSKKTEKADKPKKTKEERAAEMRAERAKRLAENEETKAKEVATFSGPSYAATVDWRARRFLEKAAGDFGFAVGLVGMFLLGMWFVRSGVMDNTRANLPFFRKLALYALPIGIGMGLLGSLIGVSHTPGVRGDGWGIGRGLLNLGNLPACLGYVGLVVVLLHSNTVFSRIRVLAPLGRMALTNYLAQSIICVGVFYGFALGHWGLSRSAQVLFVVVVYALQVAFSHWWLKHFRYGPMEWFWRGFTYRQVPPFCVAPAASGATAVGAS